MQKRQWEDRKCTATGARDEKGDSDTRNYFVQLALPAKTVHSGIPMTFLKALEAQTPCFVVRIMSDKLIQHNSIKEFFFFFASEISVFFLLMLTTMIKLNHLTRYQSYCKKKKGQTSISLIHGKYIYKPTFSPKHSKTY